jgi:DNA-binding HxlR family transcriptional regulator
MYSSNCNCQGCICKPESGGVCFCQVQGTMELLGKRCGLLIFTIIGNFGKVRYSELEKKLDGVSPRTLTDRLRKLESANLIRRETFDEIPLRVEYSLTQEGARLMDALVPMAEWASSGDHVNRSRYSGPCPCAVQKLTEESH